MIYVEPAYAEIPITIVALGPAEYCIARLLWDMEADLTDADAEIGIEPLDDQRFERWTQAGSACTVMAREKKWTDVTRDYAGDIHVYDVAYRVQAGDGLDNFYIKGLLASDKIGTGGQKVGLSWQRYTPRNMPWPQVAALWHSLWLRGDPQNSGDSGSLDAGQEKLVTPLSRVSEKGQDAMGSDLIEWQKPQHPTWGRARQFLAEARGAIEAIVMLGAEIHALRDEFFSTGGRPDGRITVAMDRGWQAKVEEELGISFRTALRIMERAYSIVCMKRLESGLDVSYVDASSKEHRTLLASEELRGQAARALVDVETGLVAAPRAWAGLVGEAARRGAQGGSVHRAEVDYRKKVAPAATTLVHALQAWPRMAWDELPADSRESALARMRELLRALPESMRAEMHEIIIEEWPRAERDALAAEIARRKRKES
jgi:hypothetical protein